MSRGRLLLLAASLLAVLGFFAFGLERYLSIDYFQSRRADLEAWRAARPIAAAAAYFGVYVAVTALSLPGAAILTLAAGAIFGLGWGTLIVSFASTLGATLAFLSARFLLRDWVEARFGARLAAINAGMRKDGGFYLFTLRLVPAFPFFMINLLMGLTPIPARRFYWVSQIGMLAGTLVYVNAGTQLAGLHSAAGILSPALLLSFTLLGLFPLLARRLLGLHAARNAYARWPRPRRFERNLIVIGAGSAGLVSAYIAAAVKAKVTLIEAHRMGGDCLNTGCVPSKAFIRSARVFKLLRRAGEFGLRADTPQVDFAAVMARVQGVITAIAPHDAVERYTALGVEVLVGHATLETPWIVRVNGPAGTTRLSARAVVIAAGARPFVPPIQGLDQTGYYTSDNIWSLRSLPQRLLVLGGGPIGCELAQAFARLGAQVSIVEMLPRLLLREDPEVSQRLLASLQADGVRVLLGHQAVAAGTEGDTKFLRVEHEGATQDLPFDALLLALGRSANLTGYGLEELGIATGRTLQANEFMQTTLPNIYCAGDVAGPYQFTHVAAHQAWYAAVNALFDPFKKFRADYRVIPWVTFTDPEIARVGLNEQEAREKNIPYEVTHYALDDLDRAIAEGCAEGFVKVLTAPGKDRILGVTIVGENAGELLAEWVLAMKHGIGLNKMLGTIHVYPTLAEANKYAAGVWKRNHAPQRLLAWVERFHAWRRG
ncbi:MAG: FAD-dependent oxidoreductase [Rhodocyclaceae bacterium]|nr:FAD-dependent oxidoreductase [Rhodocyclaceae bacterium]